MNECKDFWNTVIVFQFQLLFIVSLLALKSLFHFSALHCALFKLGMLLLVMRAYVTNGFKPGLIHLDASYLKIHKCEWDCCMWYKVFSEQQLNSTSVCSSLKEAWNITDESLHDALCPFLSFEKGQHSITGFMFNRTNKITQVWNNMRIFMLSWTIPLNKCYSKRFQRFFWQAVFCKQTDEVCRYEMI